MTMNSCSYSGQIRLSCSYNKGVHINNENLTNFFICDLNRHKNQGHRLVEIGQIGAGIYHYQQGSG
jgi:hypothetical protein